MGQSGLKTEMKSAIEFFMAAISLDLGLMSQLKNDKDNQDPQNMGQFHRYTLIKHSPRLNSPYNTEFIPGLNLIRVHETALMCLSN